MERVIALAAIAVTLVIAVQWRRGNPSLGWVVAALGSFAVSHTVFVEHEFVLERANTEGYWVYAFLGLLAAPWCWLRFAMAVRGVRRRWRWAGDAAAAGMLAWTVARTEFYAVGYTELPPAAQAYTTASTAFFVVVSGSAVVLLLRSQRGASRVVQSRTRLLAGAVALFFVAQLALGVRDWPLVLVPQLLMLVTLRLVHLGAAPPRKLRDAWQAPQLRALLAEIRPLVEATEEADIAKRFLPAVAQAAGARGALLRHAEGGAVIGCAGATEAEFTREAVETIVVRAGMAELVLLELPGEPFGGPGVLREMQALGELVGLALQRCELQARERALAASQAAVTQALELANAELQQVAQVRAVFVSMASQELRTPVTALIGGAAKLRDQWLDLTPTQRLDYLRIIGEQAARLQRLVEDMLLVSRIDEGSVGVRVLRVNAEQAIRAAVQELDASGALGIEVMAGEQVEALVDPRHLHQVLVNLLTNAVAHGEAPVRVEVESHSLAAGRVRVAVVDAGPGVARDVRERMFDSFTRSRSAAVRGTGGTGLGLFIARNLLLAQGGELSYEPADPRGSRFVVDLPRAPGSPTSPQLLHAGSAS